MARNITTLALGLLTLGPCALAQQAGEPLPRHLTDAERELLAANPLAARRGGAAPTGPLWCPPEYAPTEAIFMAWEGSGSWNNILAQMGARITTVGDADVYMVAETANLRNAAENALSNAGADMSRVRFLSTRLDSIWIRDYGPRFAYEGGVRVIIDHTYNRPRQFDDQFPDFFATLDGVPSYDIPLVHGGGNFHLSGLGDAHATTLIEDENPGLSRDEIVGYWQEYQGLDTTIHPAFRQSVDSTQHIDMWMIPVADRTIIISDWPLTPGSYEDDICDSAAASLGAMGYTVVRAPAASVQGVHYTYANAVICNDLVCIPSYTRQEVSPFNDDALAAWQQACPDKTIVQIPSQSIVSAAGVLHCIVKHMPRAFGGADPTIYLRSLNEPATLEPGEQVALEWISDDDIDTYYVKLELSLDGGQTWPIIIDPFVLDNGQFAWTVPDVATSQGRLKAIVYDWNERIGEDVNDAQFAINGSGGCVADFNGDGTVNTQDVLSFLNAWNAGEGSADINGDGTINTLDVMAFLNAWNSGC